jgi:hypothetical protein
MWQTAIGMGQVDSGNTNNRGVFFERLKQLLETGAAESDMGQSTGVVGGAMGLGDNRLNLNKYINQLAKWKKATIPLDIEGPLTWSGSKDAVSSTPFAGLHYMMHAGQAMEDPSQIDSPLERMKQWLRAFRPGAKNAGHMYLDKSKLLKYKVR